jgi:hypothetical protein
LFNNPVDIRRSPVVFGDQVCRRNKEVGVPEDGVPGTMNSKPGTMAGGRGSRVDDRCAKTDGLRGGWSNAMRPLHRCSFTLRGIRLSKGKSLREPPRQVVSVLPLIVIRQRKSHSFIKEADIESR